MKKLINLFLLFVILMSLSPVQSLAADTSTVESSETTDTLPESKDAITSDTTESTASSSDVASSNTASSENEEVVAETSDEPQVTVADVTQTGSSTAPFLVSNASELSSALANAIPSGSDALYIKFLNNIDYNFTGQVINKNTVIDGGNYNLTYTGTAYTAIHFVVRLNNLNITLKNINYKNASSYYGILTVASNATGNQVNIENVTYNVSRGGQPFYSDVGNNTLNFSGTNDFYVDSSGGDNQEFSEGFSNINFKKDSVTKIHQNTSSSEGVFWMKSNGTMNLEENAQVNIESGKYGLFYVNGSMNLNVGKSAQFNFNRINGFQPTYNDLIRVQSTMNISTGEDAEVNFSTEAMGMNVKTVNIYANKTSQVAFRSTGSQAAIAQGTANFLRQDDSNSLYQINSEANGVTTTLVDKVPYNQWQTVNSTSYSGKSAIIYERMLSLEGITAAETVGRGVSRIDANTSGYKTMKSRNNSMRYLLSSQQLTTQADIKTAYDQMLTTNPNAAKEITSSAVPDAPLSFSNLPAGNYYVYGQAVASTTGATATTDWVQATVTVPEYKDLSIVSTIDFWAFRPKITKEDNLDFANYQVINYGNTTRSLSLNNLTVNSGSASDVTLVDQLTEGKDSQLALSLVAQKNDSQDEVKWGPLLANKGSTASLSLTPYWQTDHGADLYVTGNFSGPYDVIKNVSYTLHFDIATVTS
ncbi:hypothetical protein [Enterococcus alishanensis]